MRFRLFEASSSGVQYEKIFRNTDANMDEREVALVKCLEQSVPDSPLYKFLSRKIRVEELSDAPDGAESNFKKVIADTARDRAQLKDVFTAVFNSVDSGSSLFEDVILMLNLNKIPTSRYYNLVALAKEVIKNRSINTKQKYLLNTSLYDRETADFVYTLKILDIAHNNSKLSKYFDPKEVNINELYDGADIKPAGILIRDPDDTDTIFGTVESWGETSKSGRTDANDTNKSESNIPTFKSTEAADKKGENSVGNVIHIDGNFKFNGKKWEPFNR